VQGTIIKKLGLKKNAQREMQNVAESMQREVQDAITIFKTMVSNFGVNL